MSIVYCRWWRLNVCIVYADAKKWLRMIGWIAFAEHVAMPHAAAYKHAIYTDVVRAFNLILFDVWNGKV